MTHCLGIPEILRLVCSEVGRSSSLSIGLTCQAFLEAALDEIWHDLDSFQPLICCSPEDSLTGDEILTMQRVLNPEDLKRYLSVYAQRIRLFALHLGETNACLDIDVFSSLQMVTEYRFGALSPHLRHFTWPSPNTRYWRGSVFTEHISPFVSLFLGDSVQSIEMECCGEADLHPLHERSTIFNTKRLPQVKALRLACADPYEELATRYITSLPWPCLESVILHDMFFHSADPLCTLSKLQHLRHLEIADTEGILSAATNDASAAALCHGDASSFSSLRVIVIRSYHLWSLRAVLLFLPPTNVVEEFEAELETLSDRSDIQNTIETILEYCNPSTFQRLKWVDCTVPGATIPEESIDPELEDDVGDVDIWGLCKFAELNHMTIWSGGHITLQPQDIPKVVTSWPNLNHLDLCSMAYSDGRMPSLNHTHLLEIVQGCLSLRYLGLRFDTCQLTGEEIPPTTNPF
ncbi:hypothetical protein FA13DRAFT_1839923 [Coprinellus micaceus]|uniref:F-box domain-containing protein n=1 Tax=Coprinellus micaceus TaxID=71717 RepID=A0A4Y7TEG6_COPMI|nr:hypothetical protein FA13DRAFT_1839923 [Coprinellus micaceus]